jgi:hypothetical protein
MAERESESVIEEAINNDGGLWRKLLAIFMQKQGQKKFNISVEEMRKFHEALPDACVVAHWHAESVDIMLVTMEEALRLQREHNTRNVRFQ